MAITKEQVKAAIKKADASDISISEKSDTLSTEIWTLSGAWQPSPITLNGKIELQTENLIKVLKDLHKKSEKELVKYKSYLGQLGTMGAGLLRSIAGFSPTSWFDYMISAMKLFGEYVTEKLETKGSVPSKQDKEDVKDLAAEVEKMIQHYVDHSLYRKIGPAFKTEWEGKSINEMVFPDLDSTKELVATLCRCVNYGLFHKAAKSWMKNIIKLTK